MSAYTEDAKDRINYRCNTQGNPLSVTPVVSLAISK
jgi:hypothetical protein